MKKIIAFITIVLIVSCSQKQKKEKGLDNQNLKQEITLETKYTDEIVIGGCSKCSCPSWRPDSANPDKCVNIRVPRRVLCQHSKSSHFSDLAQENDLEIQLIDNDKHRLEHLLISPMDSLNLIIDDNQKSFLKNQELTDLNQTIYCLQFDRYENGFYNGQRARFSVWKPKSGFSCCIIVNISRDNRIIARQRVNVTNGRMLRLLMGSVNGVSQGVSPCR